MSFSPLEIGSNPVLVRVWPRLKKWRCFYIVSRQEETRQKLSSFELDLLRHFFIIFGRSILPLFRFAGLHPTPCQADASLTAVIRAVYRAEQTKKTGCSCPLSCFAVLLVKGCATPSRFTRPLTNIYFLRALATELYRLKFRRSLILGR